MLHKLYLNNKGERTAKVREKRKAALSDYLFIVVKG